MTLQISEANAKTKTKEKAKANIKGGDKRKGSLTSMAQSTQRNYEHIMGTVYMNEVWTVLNQPHGLWGQLKQKKYYLTNTNKDKLYVYKIIQAQ